MRVVFAAIVLFACVACAYELPAPPQWGIDKLRGQSAEVVEEGGPRSGYYGVDVSNIVYEYSVSCLEKNSNDFLVVRCYESSGNVDPNCVHTVYNAWAEKITRVDLYHFPDTSQSATTQIQTSLANIKNNQIKYSTYWLDIETYAWGSSTSDNVQFISDMISALKAGGVTDIGIYTNEYNWETITGSTTDFKDVDLWYASWNYYPSFNDFSPFGGWETPTMHQYIGSDTICGVGVDVNWRSSI